MQTLKKFSLLLLIAIKYQYSSSLHFGIIFQIFAFMIILLIEKIIVQSNSNNFTNIIFFIKNLRIFRFYYFI